MTCAIIYLLGMYSIVNIVRDSNTASHIIYSVLYIHVHVHVQIYAHTHTLDIVYSLYPQIALKPKVIMLHKYMWHNVIPLCTIHQMLPVD